MLIAICRTAKNKPEQHEFGKINGTFGNPQAQVTSIGKRLPKSEVNVLAIRGGEMELSQDTLGVPGGTPATVHSRFPLDPDSTVTDSSGHRHRLVDLPERTSIHCPVH